MRFLQPAYPTVHFSNKIWVKCPECGDIGLVETELGKYTIPFSINHKSTFTCTRCGLSKKTDEKWYGYYQGFVSRSCGFCGSQISYTTEPTKAPNENVTLKCQSSHRDRDYPLNWYRYKEEKPTDPYFELQLWLQTDVKDKIIWFYNMDHLEYLNDYISSKLREDDGRHKYSMITNLPQWIKSAKNRDLILKKMHRLEIEFNKVKGI
jgi:hypothetical protein